MNQLRPKDAVRRLVRCRGWCLADLEMVACLQLISPAYCKYFMVAKVAFDVLADPVCTLMNEGVSFVVLDGKRVWSSLLQVSGW